MARRLREILVPRGSRRDRALWLSWLTVRKMREGPLPWLRAVRTGVYQLMPARLQDAMLAVSGKKRIGKGAGLRVNAAGDGLERAGRVSVVLPVYEQADMLAGAVRSVLTQTHRDLELIVVDDGSRDDVDGALAPFAMDPRLRVLRQSNQGLPKALSTGFEFTTGEFFTWTSADNLMGERQLERMVAFLREREDVAMVYADYEIIDGDGRPVIGTDFRVVGRESADDARIRLPRDTKDLNVVRDNFIGACFMYRSAVGRLLGDYNPELGLEDYDYWMRVNRLFRLEHLGTDEVLYGYRLHDKSLTSRARELKLHERGEALMKYERRRAEWDEAETVVSCDAEARAWLQLLCEELRAWDATSPTHDGKQLVVIAARSIGQVEIGEVEIPAAAATAVWFDDVEDVYRHHEILRSPLVVAFGLTPEITARLAVFTRRAFTAQPGAQLLDIARRFCADATFLHANRSATELERVVPQPARSDPRPMRVLLQVEHYVQGGLERVVTDLAVELGRLGADVQVLAIGDLGVEAERTSRSGVRVQSLAGDRDPARYREFVQRGGFDVVSAHHSLHGAAVLHELGVPFVQTIHNSYVWLPEDEIAAWRAADEMTRAYVAVSARSLLYADVRLRLDVDKSLVVQNGIECAPLPDVRDAVRRELGIAEGEFVFLEAAAIGRVKGQRLAVQALARARAARPGVRLVLLGRAGDRVYERALRSDVERLGLEDAVVFAGFQGDVASHLAGADAFLLPSVWEGWSLAVLEAIVAGLPLVLTDAGAAREQAGLARRCGLLAEVVDQPFGSVTDLDWTNCVRVTNAIDEAHVERIAAAMVRIVDAAGSRRAITPPPELDCALMARRYAQLFGWLRAGGEVAGVRESIARLR